jgi:hypothetical protein
MAAALAESSFHTTRPSQNTFGSSSFPHQVVQPANIQSLSLSLVPRPLPTGSWPAFCNSHQRPRCGPTSSRTTDERMHIRTSTLRATHLIRFLFISVTLAATSVSDRQTERRFNPPRTGIPNPLPRGCGRSLLRRAHRQSSWLCSVAVPKFSLPPCPAR